jgi:diguanylate cyclase (GGDEF)-like protein
MTGGLRLGGLVTWLTAAPDEVLADAAREGELVVARVRTWLTLLLTLSPLTALLIDPDSPQNYVGLAMVLLAVLAAVMIERTLQTGHYRPGISFVSALTDVSLVSLALFVYWLVGAPTVTTNSRVVFECYFLGIAASALRYDPRVTLAAGGGAMLEHLGLSGLAWFTHRHDPLFLADPDYGAFAWSTQISRTILLAGMTMISLAVVARAQRLRRLSTGDRLTGLFNRAYAEEFLANEVLRTARAKTSLVVAMLDVDHFKHFNDTHGHAAGDAALRSVADVLRRALRRSDVVARYGGEEILIVLPGTNVRAALDKLDEIRVRIGLTDLPLPRGGFGRLTVSIGVAAWDADGRTVDALLDVADARLYAAKGAGRNRIVGPESVGMLGAGERERGDARGET